MGNEESIVSVAMIVFLKRMKGCLLAQGHCWEFMPGLVLLISGIISCIWAAVTKCCLRGKTSVSFGSKAKSWNKKWKLIEFAIGMVGSALFQYFFRLTSFDHVLVFLYLSATWLGNIAMVRSTRDFCVFNFLLGNVIVGSAVDQSGLGGNTWIVYGASVFLFAVRLLLK